MTRPDKEVQSSTEWLTIHQSPVSRHLTPPSAGPDAGEPGGVMVFGGLMAAAFVMLFGIVLAPVPLAPL